MPRNRNGGRVQGLGEAPPIYADRNGQRRAAYAANPDLAQRTRDAARERHQGRPPQPVTQLRTQGERREIDGEGFDHPITAVCYTIPQAAEALGRPLATFRRWLSAGKVPSPIYWETTRSTSVYTQGELEVFLSHLAQHAENYSNLVSTYTDTTERLHQAIHAYRAEFF